MSPKRIGQLLIGISSFIFILGQMNLYTDLFSGVFLGDLLKDNYANAWTELGSIALTILVIDRVYERRGIEQEKERLVLQMGSPNNAFTLEAVRSLRNRNWLSDGTLSNARLRGANLSNADLSDANLSGADLTKAVLRGAMCHRVNFSGAIAHDTDFGLANFSQAILQGIQLSNSDLKVKPLNLSSEQLASAHSLCRAKMISGKPYNGRFNLEGDLLNAKFMKAGSSEAAMAAFYDIPIANFKWGQEWYEFYMSPPNMYDPRLERWHELDEDPEGSYARGLIDFA